MTLTFKRILFFRSILGLPLHIRIVIETANTQRYHVMDHIALARLSSRGTSRARIDPPKNRLLLRRTSMALFNQNQSILRQRLAAYQKDKGNGSSH
jgi:hypothetical protein